LASSRRASDRRPARAGSPDPAIKPLSLHAVYKVAQAVEVPIVGIGGIRDADDVMEFIVAGATAVQVGTSNFTDPAAAVDVASQLHGVRPRRRVLRLGSDAKVPRGSEAAYVRLEETPPSMVAKAVDTYLAVAWCDEASKRRPNVGIRRVRHDRRRAREVHGRPPTRENAALDASSRQPQVPVHEVGVPGTPRPRRLLLRGRYTTTTSNFTARWIDFDGWLALRRFNAELKIDIERALGSRGGADVRRGSWPRWSARRVERRPPPTLPLVLVVDDDLNIAAGMAWNPS
jgi:hypothetical protein